MILLTDQKLVDLPLLMKLAQQENVIPTLK
jgi:hypothetical protein